MPTKKTDAPGWTPPAESEVQTDRPIEFAPPGSVEWKSDDKHPEEWRPSDSPQSPTRVGGDEWTAPERSTPAPDRGEPAPERGDPAPEPGKRQE